MGKYTDEADNMSEYLSKRQNYLSFYVLNHKGIWRIYGTPVFPNCRFAEGYREELNYIEDFEISRGRNCKNVLHISDSRAFGIAYKKHRLSI